MTEVAPERRFLDAVSVVQVELRLTELLILSITPEAPTAAPGAAKTEPKLGREREHLMQRKILAICTALVALGALALAPAMASAHSLKDTNALGETVTVGAGAKITAIGTGAVGHNSVFADSTGNLKVTCSENSLTGTVISEGGANAVVGEITAATYSGTESETKCPGGSLLGPTKVTISPTSLPWCIRTIVPTDKFKVEPNKCGGAAGVFTFTLDGSITCGFERKEPVEGTFTTGGATHTASTLSLNVAGFTTDKVTNHSIFCPAAGNINEMKFNLYTDTAANGGNSAYTESEKDPVWIEP